MKKGQITCSACSHVFSVPAHARAAICPRCGQALPVFVGSIEPTEVPPPRPKKPPPVPKSATPSRQLARIALKKSKPPTAQPPPVPPASGPPTFSTVPDRTGIQQDLPSVPQGEQLPSFGALNDNAEIIPIETEEFRDDDRETETYDAQGLDLDPATQQMDQPQWDSDMATSPDLPPRGTGFDLPPPPGSGELPPPMGTGVDLPRRPSDGGLRPPGGGLPPLPGGGDLPPPVGTGVDLPPPPGSGQLPPAVGTGVDLPPPPSSGGYPPPVGTGFDLPPPPGGGQPPPAMGTGVDLPPPPGAAPPPRPSMAGQAQGRAHTLPWGSDQLDADEVAATEDEALSRVPTVAEGGGAIVPPPPGGTGVDLPPPPGWGAPAPAPPTAPGRRHSPSQRVHALDRAISEVIETGTEGMEPGEDDEETVAQHRAAMEPKTNAGPAPAAASADAPVSLGHSGIMVAIPEQPIEEVVPGGERPAPVRAKPRAPGVATNELAPISRPPPKVGAGQGSALKEQIKKKSSGPNVVLYAIIGGGVLALVVVAVILVLTYVLK